MVVVDPVPQAEEDQLADDRMIAVDRVAAAGVVAEVAAAVAEHVVDAVLEPLERQRGPEVVALGGVVEDDVEDHLDPGGVERPHHLLELADLAARRGAGGVAAVRGEEGQRVVAPEVEPLGPGAVGELRGELVHRHELHRRHAERLEVGDLLDDAEVGSGGGDAARGTGGEAPHMHLVDDGVGEAAAEMAVPLPVEGVVDDDALRRADDPVGAGEEPAGERPRIGVDEPGGAVEELAVLRIEGAVGLEVVELPRGEPRHEHAPDVPPAVAGGIQRDHLGRLGIVHAVVQQHPHGRGGAAVDDELHARPPAGGAILKHRAVRQRMAELQRGQRLLGVGPPGGGRRDPGRHARNIHTRGTPAAKPAGPGHPRPRRRRRTAGLRDGRRGR